MWVGTVSGLNRMLPGRSAFERVPGIAGTVRVLRQTSDGVLWIGTIGQGAFEYRDGKLTQITAPTALPSNTVLNFFEDNEKNFWIGTQAGMLRLTRARSQHRPAAPGQRRRFRNHLSGPRRQLLDRLHAALPHEGRSRHAAARCPA